MSKYNDYEFFLYAFGEKGSTLTNEKFEKGLKLIAERLIFNKLTSSKKEDLKTASEYMAQCQETLKKWLNETYNLTSVYEKNVDYFTKPYAKYINDEKHKMVRLEIEEITLNDKFRFSTVYPDMIEYYYKSGACTRNDKNEFVRQYNKMMDEIHDAKDIDNEKTLINNKIDRLSSAYPTKEQIREAYTDLLSGRNLGEIEVNFFKAPVLENGRKDDRWLTDGEKTAIVKKLDSAATKNLIKTLYANTLNIQLTTREEREAIHDMDLDYDEFLLAKQMYLRNSGLKKERGDLLDKENVNKAIEVIHTLKEIHENRPWYQKFFGYFGEVGTELQLVERLKGDLVKKGVPRNLLDDALNGNKQAKRSILNRLPEKEDRIKFQAENDRKDFFKSLGVKGVDDERLKYQVLYDGEGNAKQAFFTVHDRMALYVKENDIQEYLVDKNMLKENVMKEKYEEKEFNDYADDVNVVDELLIGKKESELRKAENELLKEFETAEKNQEEEKVPFDLDESIIENPDVIQNEEDEKSEDDERSLDVSEIEEEIEERIYGKQ